MAFGALSSGISALRSFSKGMEVIGNNIANVNTVSFKGSRIKYSETFNQVLQQSAPSPSDGQGSNVQASQVGLGVQVEGIVGQFHQGGLSATNQLTDLAISGEGFFKVVDTRNNDTEYATRGGDFRIDDNGYLVTSSGMQVQGMTGGSIGFEVDVNSDGEWTFVPNQDSQTGTIAPYKVGAIQLDYDKGNADVVGTTSAEREAVMFTNRLVGVDGTGNPVWGNIVLDGNGDVDLTASSYGGSGEDAHRVGEFVVGDDPTTVEGVTGWHAFMETAVNDLIALRNKSDQGFNGGVVTDQQIKQAVSTDFFYAMFSGDLDAAGNHTMDGGAVRQLFIGDGNLTWPTTIDADATITQVESTFPTSYESAQNIIKDVRADKTPDLSRFSIDSEGRIRYFLSNGDSFERGQVMLVDFNDKTALIREGQNLYSSFGAAGLKEPDTMDGLQVAGRNGLGLIKQGALELSNVDLTNEFAQMITTQRGFQAGSRIITVSDDILQEVVNLKR